MSTDQASAAPTSYACGACSETNPPDAKFCAGCGQSLFENCISCARPVLLSQKFCISCGTDLDAELSKRQAQMADQLAKAVAYAKDHDYETAIGMLSRLIGEADFRFQKTKQQAEQVRKKVRKLKDESTASTEELLVKAQQAHENKNPERVIQLLSKLPEQRHTDESRKLLLKSKIFVENVTVLNADLNAAVKSRDWLLLGNLVNQLQTLLPKNPSYKQIGQKVSQRLMAAATRLVNEGNYQDARDQLESVPQQSRDEQHAKLLSMIESCLWLRSQVENEPVATAALGRLAVRFAKESQQKSVSQVVQELATTVKKSPKPRHRYNDWKGSRECSFGGRFGMLGRLATIGCDQSQQQTYAKEIARLYVAIGLAIQGLGQSRVSDSFYEGKKGFLKSLSRKKSTLSWGIDIGTSGLRAVLLQISDDSITIKDIFIHTYDSPLTRADVTSPQTVLVEVLKKFVSEKAGSLEDSSVWINLPSKDTINRFICLPPVKDKQAAEMISEEEKSQIPLDVNDLSIVRWIAPLNPDDQAAGRPAFLAASRKHVVDSRVAMCAEAGLDIHGMQSDCVALVNLIAYEFADELEIEGAVEQPPAFVVIDSGVTTTSAIVVTGRSASMSSFEVGGEDFTAVVAKQAMVTLSEAEKLKHNPVAMANPDQVFAAFEPKTAMLRERLKRSFTQAEQKSHKFKITQTWCTGGGSMLHSWMRHVLSKTG